MVALARKLSGILYAMLRDGSAYDPAKLKGAAAQQGRAGGLRTTRQSSA